MKNQAKAVRAINNVYSRAWLTVTLTTAISEKQLLLSVPVTVYAVLAAGKAIGFCIVELFNVFEGDQL